MANNAFKIACGLIAAVSAFIFNAIAIAAPPAAAYGQLPAIDSAALSADGKSIALLRADGPQFIVEARDTTSFALAGALAPEPGGKLRAVDWSADGHLLVWASVTHDTFANEVHIGSFIKTTRDKDTVREFRRVMALTPQATNPVILLAKENDIINIGITAVWPGTAKEPGKVRIGKMTRYGALAAWSVMDADLKTGDGKIIVQGNEHTETFILDANSEVVGRVDTDDKKNVWTLFARDGNSWRSIYSATSDTGESPIVSATLPDGRFAAIGRIGDDDRDSLAAIDPKTGQTTKLFSDARYDVGGYIKDRWTNTIVGASHVADFSTQTFFDPQLQKVRDAVAAKFPNTYALLESWDAARSLFVVRAQASGGPPALYLYRAAQGQLQRLGSLYPSVDDASSGQRVALTYKARDGTPIPSYLTTPVGQPMKNLPLVMLVHGGPASRDTFAFDYWASFLASRGYAVLQPNFRGSDGYGDKWEKAGYHQWGGLMQNDVSDGVAAMIKAGIADPARVCIVGASYGGYAALAGATMTPDLYRCAVSVGGISDLMAMQYRLKQFASGNSASVDYWRLSIGEGEANLKSLSPIQHVDAVKAPILLLHGRDDTVVPFDQSFTMSNALRNAHKNVRLVELVADDHWLSFADTRTQALTEIETFLAANLK